MVRAFVLIAAIAASACSWNADRRAQASIDEANLALRRGEPAQAESAVARGIELTKSRPDSDIAWQLRLLQADVLLAKRNLPEALQISRTAVPDGPSFEMVRARQKYLQARIAYGQGQLRDALALANEARTAARTGSELHLEIGAFTGQLRMQLGNWTEGEAQLDGVARDASTSGFRYVEAMARNAYGMGKFIRSRCDEALPSFEHVASLPEIAEMPVYAKALYNAGMCYSRLGLFDRATDLQRRAVTAAEKRPTSSDYEQALGQLGNTFLLQRNTRDGLAYMQRAYRAALDSKLPGDAAIWAGNLAVAYLNLEQWDEAERFNDEAKRLSAETRSGRPIYYLETSAAIAAGRGRHDEASRLFEQVLGTDGAPAPILWEAHYGLANIAISQKQPQRAAHEFEAALDVIETTRAGLLRTDYKLSYLTQLIAFYRGYVEHLVAQGEIERALAVADSSRGRVLAERQGAPPPERVAADRMRRLARDTGAVYLSYWLTPRHSYLWVIAPTTIKIVTLPSASEIEPLVREHQEAIANALVDLLAAKSTAGDSLYRTLVAPAAQWIPAGARVVIVPDGALYGVNFETFPVDGARRHFLVEDVEVQIAPSLASLASARPAAQPAARSALVVGNAAARPPEFPELKFASNEIASVATHFGADRTARLERDKATPAAYREARPADFRFVHFAAHATANVESPLDSAVILSGPEGAYKLYARDVAALPLAADLVTVSACRSAGQRAYSGEGLVGFAWAFLRAGARRVIAGLWDVNDRSTAELMERLYAALAADQPPPRALREAKLAMIRQGGPAASPYAWGAFEIFTVVP